ncbi:AraC family transcriptional regulator [Algoriphagus sp. Y33]|uniref:helix-turn-helix domain-containing protein n=1 Tax=Algoriphagus sp. Y33 TaxID=2772483 RepID=UPI0017863AA9|nr:AraC family transcriptional regulator [Algoriphagus sp. Y33]
MKKKKENLKRFRSISEIHQAFGMPKPRHPLISLTHFDESNPFNPEKAPVYDVMEFYKIAFTTENRGRMKYGQNYYDFNEGSMIFIAPDQLIGNSEDSDENSSYILLIHPDFLLSYPLAKKIKQYGYFSYAVNEALHLSDDEKQIIISVYRIMELELDSRVDEFSQEVMIAQIELLLSYANRFYKRQFLTRKILNDDLLQKLEEILDHHYRMDEPPIQGIPTVQSIADKLNTSPGYLSDMLRSITGQNTRQFIHHKLIGKAKELLSATDLSIGEVAYQLGFEHPQSFSKLFRIKTNMSPVEFRQSFK